MFAKSAGFTVELRRRECFRVWQQYVFQVGLDGGGDGIELVEKPSGVAEGNLPAPQSLQGARAALYEVVAFVEQA